MEEYLESMLEDMTKAIASLERDLSTVRTGRASPKLVETLQVMIQSYGAAMPLNQLATIQAPDARMLVVNPWDKSTLNDIERAIVQASLGITPSNDGQIIRLPIPALTADRRRDLVKQVRQMGEEGKVRVRHVRREYNELFKNGQKDGDISEDESRRLVDKVQVSTDDYVALIEKMVSAKEAEVQEV
ncbi:MAG: ribosome recycling factor [Deltaproteobacteria bacterium]|nr:ribosome recycling factor [Deltaproteobacteria bacterium]